jgi:hypothetical protein
VVESEYPDVEPLDNLPLGVRGEYGTTLMPSLEHRDTRRAWGSRYARLSARTM